MVRIFKELVIKKASIHEVREYNIYYEGINV